MKPALSVIAFTVLSGAGLGLTVWLVLARWLSLLSTGDWWLAVMLAVVLTTAGLFCSSLHLANPRNAWRAASRWRHSWLSREAVLALALYPVGAGYLWAVYINAQALAGLLGLGLVALALGTLYCTAMIYACLKTVPSWHAWQTRLSYPLLGLASGGVCLIPFAPHMADGGVGRLVIALLVAGALLKYSAWKDANRALPGLEAALNLSGRVRMLDAGHTGPTFLTREFGYQLKPELGRQLRWMALALAFVLPAVLISAGGAWVVLAPVPCAAGLAIERWLFFAQARHVVRVYHGLA